MRRLCIILVLACQILFASAQSAEESKVNNTIVQFFDGIAKLDMNKIKEHSTKDLMLLEDGAVWNMDSISNIVNMFKGVEFLRKNNLNFIQTDVKGKTAWVAYHNNADIIVSGQSMSFRWLESAVLVKEQKSWKVKLLHSTVLKPDKH